MPVCTGFQIARPPTFIVVAIWMTFSSSVVALLYASKFLLDNAHTGCLEDMWLNHESIVSMNQAVVSNFWSAPSSFTKYLRPAPTDLLNIWRALPTFILRKWLVDVSVSIDKLGASFRWLSDWNLASCMTWDKHTWFEGSPCALQISSSRVKTLCVKNALHKFFTTWGTSAKK